MRITSTAICGSDLHLHNGFVPTMSKLSLDQAPEAYQMLRDKQDGCVKVVLKN